MTDSNRTEGIPRAPEFNEDILSKLPALHLLINMGYQYLKTGDAARMRHKKYNCVLLKDILITWLKENNTIHFKNQTHPFSDTNIDNAIRALEDFPTHRGLLNTNEKIYDLLCLGKSLKQSINGDLKSFTLKYIDWDNPQNNHFHVTEEFTVERSGDKETRRPDIVLFVNGIPLVVIENKAPGKNATEKAVSQHIKNQEPDQIPQLFHYSQILLALSKDDAQYATTRSGKKFWFIWREENDTPQFEDTVYQLINRPLETGIVDTLFTMPSRKQGADLGIVKSSTAKRMVTPQDRLLYALCHPPRLLELIFRYILFDKGVKKIARYQQYFCVQKTLSRLQVLDADSRRRGGLVFHTQGSGKSLTMVLLAKALALCPHIPNYRILLVTDRINLDDQISKTFRNCGREVEKAKSGKDLSKLLASQKSRIITTVIGKFTAAVEKYPVRCDDPNIFVLVDEGHRGQHGTLHANMRRVLTNACYIGFTGTPVMKKDRNTIEKFGGIIDTYTIDRAVADKAVVPLLYEGRHVDQTVDKTSIDDWFDRITAKLSSAAAQDLKRKYATTDQLNKTERKVMKIALDISDHYVKNWQTDEDIPFKAQLVTQDKATAMLYKHYLDYWGMVTSEVLISGPKSPESEDDLYHEDQRKVERFWNQMMDRFGSEKSYNETLIEQFKEEREPEIIIVVDKLLTGFDAPRNTVLYLTRKLKDHTLLQAIARVNRVCDGKEYGYIIDYRGVLCDLDRALDLYTALPEYDRRDIEEILMDIRREIETLPAKHAQLWDLFKEVVNKQDDTEYSELLADESLRTRFYQRLSLFARAFGIAVSTHRFHEETPADHIDRYKHNLKFFTALRNRVRFQYADAVDFKEYEPRIRKLLDTHIGTGEIEEITPLVNIFDKEAFARELDKLPGTGARADAVAHQVHRVIRDRMAQDPAFYKKFSLMLEETIRAFREKRITDNEYLDKVNNVKDAVVNGTHDNIPPPLKDKDTAVAYFGVISESLSGNRGTKDLEDPTTMSVDFALAIDRIIEANRIVNWVDDIDVHNKMRDQIEDFILDYNQKAGLKDDFDLNDDIMAQCIDIARARRA